MARRIRPTSGGMSRAMAALIKSVGTAGSGVGGGGGPIYAKNQKKWHSTPGGDQGAGM